MPGQRARQATLKAQPAGSAPSSCWAAAWKCLLPQLYFSMGVSAKFPHSAQERSYSRTLG